MGLERIKKRIEKPIGNSITASITVEHDDEVRCEYSMEKRHVPTLILGKVLGTKKVLAEKN